LEKLTPQELELEGWDYRMLKISQS